MAATTKFCVVADIEIASHDRMSDALDAVFNADGASAAWVLAMNPEKVVKVHRDPSLSSLLSSASLRIADGIGLVWLMRWRGCKSAVRIPGIEFWLGAMERAAETGASVYLLGGRGDVAERAARVLQERFAGLRVVGTHHGYLDDVRAASIESEIASLHPDVVVVAMGSPRQELEIEKIRTLHPDGLYLGVGGGFDVIAGDVSRAPRFALRHNLEWLWRLLRQPSRAWRYRSLGEYLYLAATRKI